MNPSESNPSAQKILIFAGVGVLVFLFIIFVVITTVAKPKLDSANKTLTEPAPTQVESNILTTPVSEKSVAGILMKVGDEAIYQQDYDTEAAAYRSVNNDQTRRVITNKLITDSAILQGGRAAGFINLDATIYSSADKNYAKRIAAIETVKGKVMQSADTIQGKIISIWFYNNGYIGPQGYDKGKQIAFQKITQLHDSIQSGKMTIEQAGDQIKADTSLAELDVVYGINAIQGFAAKKGEPITFDEDFNTMIRALPVGGVSQVFLAKSVFNEKEQPRDAVYMVAQVESISKDGKIVSLDQWIRDQKVKYAVVK